jgi:antirestriction protein ArdC
MRGFLSLGAVLILTRTALLETYNEVKNKMMNEKVRSVIDNILASFESGDIPEALSIAVLPRLDVPCSHWSFLNRVVAWLSGSSDCRGFRQWKAVSRSVKKGSKAIFILAPSFRKKRKDEEENEGEELILTGFLTVPVFRYEDTKGEPLDIPELKPRDLPPLFDVAQAWNIDVDWHSYAGDGFGFYSPSRSMISLATHNEGTFFHELGHAAHHRFLGHLKKGQVWDQEVVAELTATVLAHVYGKKVDLGGSFRYIRSYAEKANLDPHRACLKVIQDVEQCVDLIIQEHEAEQTPTVEAQPALS